MPRAASWLTARPWNAVVAMRPAAVLVLASSIASWRLHDVQEPQSPEPAKTRSQVFASSASSSAGAGVEQLDFFLCTTAATP